MSKETIGWRNNSVGARKTGKTWFDLNELMFLRNVVMLRYDNCSLIDADNRQLNVITQYTGRSRKHAHTET